MNTQKQIEQLVKNECACHSTSCNDIKNYCDREWTEGYCCIFFIEKPEDNARCSYFERAVLGMNPQLETAYKLRGRELTQYDKKQIAKVSQIKGKVNTHCKKCGKSFLADNYRTQYCEVCKKYIQRKNKRDWISKKRNITVEYQLPETVDV